MIQIVKSNDRHFNDFGWLQTYWLFSFSNYHDPENISHGRLRVFNDDIVKAQKGFDTHPHEEMEIISIVLDGEMVHEDTMGNTTTIRKNDVQRMTAGTGLYHSERNLSDKPVYFFQIWINPDKRGLEPSYAQKGFKPDLWQNKIKLLASDTPGEGIVSLNTEASIYRAVLEKGKRLDLEFDENRNPFIYMIKGKAEVNNAIIETRDQARIKNELSLEIVATDSSEFIMIDVPA
ncbi:MAG: pirin family protein [Candidatus Scalindua sp.]|nr:pirin family protein [Candidatus Scalindua sp.]